MAKSTCSDCGLPCSRGAKRCSTCAFEARRTYGNCKHCDKCFRVTPCYGMTFCSVTCANRYRNLRGQSSSIPWMLWGQSKSVPWATCEECSGPFVKRSTAVTCGSACSRNRRLRKAREYGYAHYPYKPAEHRLCARCESPFLVVEHRGLPKYCSPCKIVVQREARAEAKARRRARVKGAESERIVRQDIYERDGWVCQLCKLPIDRTVSPQHPMAATIDHMMPVSWGGSHTHRNVWTTHRSCNSEKSDRWADFPDIGRVMRDSAWTIDANGKRVTIPSRRVA